MMKCGHVSNAEQVLDNGDRIPACAICGCSEIDENTPDLTGRKARCCYYGSSRCHGETDSKMTLPFFKHRPNEKYDTYYCGCWGWD